MTEKRELLIESIEANIEKLFMTDEISEERKCEVAQSILKILQEDFNQNTPK